MNITDRVQIVPFGYEKVRILEPIYRFKADSVILLRQIASEDYEAPFQRDVVAELRENDRIDLETRECDLFDLDSSLQALSEVIHDHPTDDVFVNVSTGSKITAIAGMMACQTTDATPFYVEREMRSEDGEREPPDEPVVTSIDDIYDIPVFELQGPSREQLEILAYLQKEGKATKKDLIRFSESRELSFIAESESKTEEGLYRLLESHIINPLTEGEYISVEKVGRTKHVSLEDRGVDALRTFRNGKSASNSEPC